MVARRSFFLALGLALSSALAITGCHHKPPPAVETPEVYVSEPLEREYTELVHYTGRTAAVQTQQVKARVAGPIESVDFADGSEVREGQVLYEIDPRTFQAEVDAAEAKVRAAIAQLNSATDDYRRKEASGLGATEAEKVAAMEKVETAKSTLEMARADAVQKRLNLDFTKVRAKINGIISRTEVYPGTIVQSGEAGGTLLTTIDNIDPIYVYFDVDGRTWQRVQRLVDEGKFASAEAKKHDAFFSAASTFGAVFGRGTPLLNAATGLYPTRSFTVIPLRMELEDETGFPHKGYIDFVDKGINPATGTIRTRGLFWNHDHRLRAGMFVRVEAPVGEERKVLMVPDRAIITDQDKKVLYLLNDKDEVVYRPVDLGAVVDGLRIIEKGLTSTDRVIIDGTQRVRPGATATPKPTTITPNREGDAAKPANN
jgi:RND family efflux transporter MFP subunit